MSWQRPSQGPDDAAPEPSRDRPAGPPGVGTDVGVVGAGIVGLATAYELARRGASVTVYERGVPGNGQSGGDSRIFRHVHSDPRLVEIAREARAGWRRWEDALGEELLVADGVVVLGPGFDGFEGRVLGDVAEVLPIADAPGDVLLDEEGGVIRTRTAIAALAGALGDAIVADEALSVQPSGEVRTGGRTASHDRVVVCAGRGTAELARGAGVSLPVSESVHVRLTFQVRTPPERLACFLDTEAGAYGDPLPGNARYAVGIGDTDAAGLAAEAGRTAGYVASRFPGLDPEPAGVRHCWVTELPWGHDGIGVWEEGRALFVAGNNMFKHAPALGEALAAAALGEPLDPRLRAGAELGRGPSRGAPHR